jgi:hypothetical protein
MTLTADAFNLWAIYQQLPGWQEIPSAAVDEPRERGLPEPGDVMIFKDHGVGHASIVISVKAPHNQENGSITFANANSTSPYDTMPLWPNLQVDTSKWTSDTYVVWGYLRPKITASSGVHRVAQSDPKQYNASYPMQTWERATSSTAAITEVLNAYGYSLRMSDVLPIEQGLGDDSPTTGLTSEAGIAATLDHYLFTTKWSDHFTLAQILVAANLGTPVIVSFKTTGPPGNVGESFVVVTRGDSGSVTIMDASDANLHTLNDEQLTRAWQGYAAVATPTWYATPTPVK